jgi:hypothetical protein
MEPQACRPDGAVAVETGAARRWRIGHLMLPSVVPYPHEHINGSGRLDR